MQNACWYQCLIPNDLLLMFDQTKSGWNKFQEWADWCDSYKAPNGYIRVKEVLSLVSSEVRELKYYIQSIIGQSRCLLS